MRAWWLLVMTACGRFHFEEASLDDGNVGDGSVLRDGMMPSGAYAFWKFDEGSGATTVDSTGNASSLMLMGATWTNGIAGGGVHGNGVNQYLVSATNLDLGGSSALTFSVWLRYTSGGPGPYNNVFEVTDNFNNATNGLGMFVDDTSDCTTPQIGIGLTGDVGGNAGCYAPPSSGQWHHIVAVYDKTRPGCCETQLYVDGISQTATPTFLQNNTNGYGSTPLYLLARGGAMAFTAADLDELAIYRRALAPAEIAAF